MFPDSSFLRWKTHISGVSRRRTAGDKRSQEAGHVEWIQSRPQRGASHSVAHFVPDGNSAGYDWTRPIAITLPCPVAKLNQLSGPQAKAPDVYYAFAGAATFFNELLGVQGRNAHQRSKSQRLHAQGNAMAKLVPCIRQVRASDGCSKPWSQAASAEAMQAHLATPLVRGHERSNGETRCNDSRRP